MTKKAGSWEAASSARSYEYTVSALSFSKQKTAAHKSLKDRIHVRQFTFSDIKYPSQSIRDGLKKDLPFSHDLRTLYSSFSFHERPEEFAFLIVQADGLLHTDIQVEDML